MVRQWADYSAPLMHAAFSLFPHQSLSPPLSLSQTPECKTHATTDVDKAKCEKLYVDSDYEG